MNIWAEVLKGVLEFLEKPTGLAVVVVLAFFALVLYTIPIGALLWVNWDGTNRIVTAISELKTDLKPVVERRVANRPEN